MHDRSYAANQGQGQTVHAIVPVVVNNRAFGTLNFNPLWYRGFLLTFVGFQLLLKQSVFKVVDSSV